MSNLATIDNIILQEVKDYWEVRSDSYSKQNIAELHCFKRDAWRKLILENAPQKEQLRILDVGTGPGFFAINLSLCGHEVAAVDITQGMLEEAANNAKHYGAKVKFQQANVHELPFEDGSFDLVISRNVVWNLEEPEKAFNEWKRVLAKGGRILYYDANWYLYLYDEEVRLQYEKAKRKAEELYPQGDVPNDIAIKMEEIAYNLPLSREYRPQWDREILEKNGMKIIKVQEDIGKLVWDEEEKIRYAATPMFMVCAEL